jgi:hypothetical protein
MEIDGIKMSRTQLDLQKLTQRVATLERTNEAMTTQTALLRADVKELERDNKGNARRRFVIYKLDEVRKRLEELEKPPMVSDVPLVEWCKRIEALEKRIEELWHCHLNTTEDFAYQIGELQGFTGLTEKKLKDKEPTTNTNQISNKLVESFTLKGKHHILSEMRLWVDHNGSYYSFEDIAKAKAEIFRRIEKRLNDTGHIAVLWKNDVYEIINEVLEVQK